MLPFVKSRQLQIGCWCGSGFFQEAMQQNHSFVPIDVKEDARNAISE
jgi:hypothetical protein